MPILESSKTPVGLTGDVVLPFPLTLTVEPVPAAVYSFRSKPVSTRYSGPAPAVLMLNRLEKENCRPGAVTSAASETVTVMMHSPGRAAERLLLPRAYRRRVPARTGGNLGQILRKVGDRPHRG